jgi:hypothetical protein
MGSVTVAETTRALGSSGWSLGQQGQETYAVENASGVLSWMAHEGDPAAIVPLLDDPARQQQWVGVTLQHRPTGAPGHLFFHPRREDITFSPSNHRRTITDTELTDLPWYLETMLPGLHSIGLMGYTMRDHLASAGR